MQRPDRKHCVKPSDIWFYEIPSKRFGDLIWRGDGYTFESNNGFRVVTDNITQLIPTSKPFNGFPEDPDEEKDMTESAMFQSGLQDAEDRGISTITNSGCPDDH